MSWGPAQVERLKHLHADGCSCAEIARTLTREFPAPGYTRAAVIGKLWRLGLSSDAQTARLNVKRNRPKAEPRPPVAAPEPSPYVDRHADAWAPLPGVPPVLRLHASKRHCQWPITVDGDELGWCCGAAAKRGPYCVSHDQRSKPENAGPKARAIDSSHARAIFGRKAA